MCPPRLTLTGVTLTSWVAYTPGMGDPWRGSGVLGVWLRLACDGFLGEETFEELLEGRRGEWLVSVPGTLKDLVL